jgi:hypothetical protein
LAIFLAAAAASFSPVIVGRGNLIKRLWFILAVVVIPMVLNELTKASRCRSVGLKILPGFR